MKKNILVTGGNRGIGLEICRQLAQARHNVILGSRNVEKGKTAAANLTGNIHVQQLDVTKINDIKEAAAFIEKEFGKLDVLINNCGIGVGNAGAVDANLEEVREIMETNFYGAWQTSKELIPLLQKGSEPRIVNMSSGMGEITGTEAKTGYAGYRISKTALNALTILLANELKGQIKVNTMCPGWVKTDMGGPDADRTVDQGADTAVWLAIAPNIPNGKFLRDRKVIGW